MAIVNERRAAERLELHLPSKVLTHPSAGEVITRDTILENVSSKGAYFFLEDPLPPDTSVELEIDLPKSMPSSTNLKLNFKGIVVRLEPPRVQPGRHGVAVRFDGQWDIEPVFS